MPTFRSSDVYNFRPQGASSTVVQFNSAGVAVTGSMSATEGLVLPKAAGKGIKVDSEGTPTFGWHDLLGVVTPKASGAGSLARTLYVGTDIFDWAASVNDVCDFSYHIPHDYLPASDLYVHVHWSHNGTAISGNIQWTFYHTYAKGHNQANFAAQKAVTTTLYNTVNVTTTPQFRHRIEETQLTTAGGSATRGNTTDVETDGLIIGQIKLTTAPTVTGGSVFLHYVDIHYQSTGIPTKNKAPNFHV